MPMTLGTSGDQVCTHKSGGSKVPVLRRHATVVTCTNQYFNRYSATGESPDISNLGESNRA
jgi:hypothetical protein